ncbi:MAG: hypothetical protein NTX86_01700 [Candidatus Dependentiae bacterium]|nr:hypothetical protein [Candidatus Dependentiae bacterium]
MKTKQGFSLVECVIYCGLFSMMMMVLFNWMIPMHMRLKASSSRIAKLIELYAACDVLTRDIRMASANTDQWKKVTEQELIWHSRGVDIGWSFEKNSLFRSEGTYNASSQSWVKKTKNLIADNVDTVKFQRGVDNDNNVRLVHFELNKLSTTIALKNREL